MQNLHFIADVPEREDMKGFLREGDKEREPEKASKMRWSMKGYGCVRAGAKSQLRVLLLGVK